jgi:hypothetical protein
VCQAHERIAQNKPDSDAGLHTVEFIRKECQFEMNLIGTRITWLLAAQAFLVTASVFGLASALNTNVRYGWLLCALASAISVVGTIISRKTIKAVNSARYTLDLWHERMRHFAECLERNENSVWSALILGRWSEFNDPFHQESLELSNVILPRIFEWFWWLVCALSTGLAICLARGWAR